MTLQPPLLIAGEPASIADENNVKAVYTFNFIRFTEWPETKDKRKKTVELSVLGNLQLLKTFKIEAFQNISKGIRLHAKSCDSIQLCLKESDVIFIDKSEKAPFQRHLHSVQNNPVLTISDIPGFANSGGMIELKKQGDRMIFLINLGAVRRANLYVSAELLQFAEIVEKAP